MAHSMNQYHVWLLKQLMAAPRGMTREEITAKFLARFPDRPILPRKVLGDYFRTLEANFGVRIVCDRNYRYTLDDTQPVENQGLQNWMLDTLAISGMVTDIRRLYGRVLIEPIPHGQEFLPVLMEAIRRNVYLHVSYRRFDAEQAHEVVIAPYCARVFRQRWYVTGLRQGTTGDWANALRHYALDRVEDMTLTDMEFTLPGDFDAANFYRDCYGIYDNIPPADVTLRISAEQRPWIESLPIHASQEEVERTEDYSIYHLYVRPTFDFVQHLLSYGAHVTVLSPPSLREEMQDRLAASIAEYLFDDDFDDELDDELGDDLDDELGDITLPSEIS